MSNDFVLYEKDEVPDKLVKNFTSAFEPYSSCPECGDAKIKLAISKDNFTRQEFNALICPNYNCNFRFRPPQFVQREAEEYE